MHTRLYEIQEVLRPHPVRIVAPTDFAMTPTGEIKPENLLQDPGFSLYCLDAASDAVLFVYNPNPSVVESAPFYYQAQANSATRVASMPIAVFLALADGIPDPPQGLVFIHSVGRCGSTLVSKALKAVGGVRSLSEPDDLTQLSVLRRAGTVSDEWLRSYIRASIKWRNKPGIGQPADVLAIKTRSEVMAVADLIGPLYPTSKHLFLYREAISWMQSVFRNFPADRDIYDAESNAEMEAAWLRILPIVGEYRREGEPMNPAQIRMLAWVTCMEAYLWLYSTGIPLCALRFEDLVAHPVPALELVFGFCDITNVEWRAIHEVLEQDSQAGTIFDREDRKKRRMELPPELAEDVRQLIATRPTLRVPEIMLPGTKKVRPQ